MKVIDLLNKIANGEEVPKKIRYDDNIFNLVINDFGSIYYKNEYGEDLFDSYNIYRTLNYEVEIIEEREMCHRCGKYPSEYNQTYCEFCLGISEEDKKIEKLPPSFYENACLTQQDRDIAKKINEIIDKINKKE